VADSCREYVAVCPCETVAEVEPPVAGLAEKSIPEANNITFCTPAESVTVRIADSLPTTEAVKVTFAWHEAPAMRVLPVQLSVSRKSAWFVPDIARVEMLTEDVPVLVTVTDCAAAALPRGSAWNPSAGEETEACGGEEL
jgi:hypothetical protein